METERVLTVAEAAERFRASRQTVRRWLREGKLRGVMPGGTKLGYRIPESEVRMPFLRPIAPSLEATFHDLVQQWHRATDHLSLLEPVLTHPAYLRIIALGEAVAPLLLRELKERPDYWFPALEAVTGENPVRPGATFDQAVEDWLAWGRERGLPA